MVGYTMREAPKMSLKCSRRIPCWQCESKLCALGVFDYKLCTIFLGAAYIDPNDIEHYIEKTLAHEWVHYVLFKHFNEEVARRYDRICRFVEPEGRPILV